MTIHAQETLKGPGDGYSKHWIDFLQMSFYILSYPNKCSTKAEGHKAGILHVLHFTVYPPCALVFFKSDAKHTQLLSICY